ncbi:hypothetical protein GALMADRAFT_273840 [Galerina marginata CBS 339.88]|uniref:F-box domain-containing protein n=1 Tax=Galerina marginata (strain CBS 339.88) TaxID=685588 RepID=A0A067SDP2_GALM3|nr:hypothetical protein GALMADRAFT_273840 [Galerina marginata CBS 339.88]
MTVTTSNLPQDIIDSIIERLPNGQYDYSLSTRNVLVACNQVSRSFHRPARQQLFSTVHIAFPRPDLKGKQKARDREKKWAGFIHKKIKELLALLHDLSDVVTLVRTLHVELEASTALMGDDSGLIDVLELLFEQAINLSSFCFAGHEQREVEWIDIGARTRVSIMKLCQSGRADSLKFENFSELPVDIIIGCAPLKSLELVRIVFAVSEAQSPGSTATWTPSQLAHLSIRKGVTEFERMCLSIGAKLSTITVFRVSIDNQQHATVARDVIQRNSQTLAILDLEYSRLDLEFLYRRSIDFGLLPALHTLRLRVSASPRPTLPTATDLLRFMKRTSRPSSIKAITIIYSTTMVDSDTFIPATSPTWQSLHPERLHENHPDLEKLQVWLDVRLVMSREQGRASLGPGMKRLSLLDPADLASFEKQMKVRLTALICTPMGDDLESLSSAKVEVQVDMWVFNLEA